MSALGCFAKEDVSQGYSFDDTDVEFWSLTERNAKIKNKRNLMHFISLAPYYFTVRLIVHLEL